MATARACIIRPTISTTRLFPSARLIGCGSWKPRCRPERELPRRISKMKALAYLRHPIVLLAAVSAAIFLIWYALGDSVQLPPSPLAAGEKLACVSYSPAADEGAAE